MTYVLVVEDDVHTQFLIQRKLELAGYKVRTTSNGREALQLAKESPPRVVILDIMLPEQSGLEVCREIKKQLAPNPPPVIVMSALGRQEDVDAGEAAGADDYLIKPFSPRDLLQLVESVLHL